MATSLEKSRLFLDDLRNPIDCVYYCLQPVYLHAHETFAIVRNYKEFVSYIQYYFNRYKKLPDLISFDHDLADQNYAPKEFWDEKYNEWAQKFTEKTGHDCAKWLVDFCIDNDIKYINYLCHSMNPVGKKNIESLLNQFNNINRDE